MTVDTDRTQSLIGWLRDMPQGTRNLELKMTNAFGASTLVSLENLPIAKAGKLLLVLGTKTSNRGFEWNEKRNSAAPPAGPA